MKELTVKEYAKLIGKQGKENAIYKRIETIDKWKKELSDLETESFGSCSLKNELKMVKLRHKIKDAIDYYKEDGHIFIFVDTCNCKCEYPIIRMDLKEYCSICQLEII